MVFEKSGSSGDIWLDACTSHRFRVTQGRLSFVDDGITSVAY
jgi:hypothetical protein